MPGDPYRRVKSGDPLQISATAWNALMQMAREAGERGALGSADVTGTQRDLDTLTVRNTATQDCPRFGILGIASPLFAPQTGGDALPRNFAGALAVRGVLATVPAYEGKWAVALEPIAQGKCGLAAVSGIVPAIVNVPSAASASFAEANGTMFARAGSSGSAQVLWLEAGTGNRYALLRLGAPSAAGTAARATVTAVQQALGMYTCTVGAQSVTVENVYETSAYYGALTYAPAGVAVTPQRIPVGATLIAVKDGSGWFACAPTAFQVTCS